jgi:hypothetical protein
MLPNSIKQNTPPDPDCAHRVIRPRVRQWEWSAVKKRNGNAAALIVISVISLSVLFWLIAWVQAFFR